MELYTIGFASDHAGFELKQALMKYVISKGYSIKDFGCYSSESCDYPEYAHPLAEAIVSGECRFGIAVCYTANGISMTVNKHKGIRAAICWNTELAALAREHNDANILSIPAKYIDIDQAIPIADTFISSEFKGGRHLRRVDKIDLKKP